MEITSVRQKKALLSEGSHGSVPAEPPQLTWESRALKMGISLEKQVLVFKRVT